MTSTSAPPRLLADIGGTHIRLAWQRLPGGPLLDTHVFATREHPTVQSAIEAYLAQVGNALQGGGPLDAALGIATPITVDASAMIAPTDRSISPEMISSAMAKAIIAFSVKLKLASDRFHGSRK